MNNQNNTSPSKLKETTAPRAVEADSPIKRAEQKETAVVSAAMASEVDLDQTGDYETAKPGEDHPTTSQIFSKDTKSKVHPAKLDDVDKADD